MNIVRTMFINVYVVREPPRVAEKKQGVQNLNNSCDNSETVGDIMLVY